ncbi:TPA: hypothetical protein I4G69_002508 [Enterobacter asburiae]|nr:hypothetical protein [Enterobacter asburiae]
MLRPAKWSIRVSGFLAVTFILMLSGIFGPLAESMKYTVTNLLNYIPYDKGPYPERVYENYFTLYIIFNAIAATAVMATAELVALIAKIEA